MFPGAFNSGFDLVEILTNDLTFINRNYEEWSKKGVKNILVNQFFIVLYFKLLIIIGFLRNIYLYYIFNIIYHLSSFLNISFKKLK